MDVEVEPTPAAAEPELAPMPDLTDDDLDFVGFDDSEGSIAKEALKSEISEGLSGAAPDKAVVGEILLALEATNPTKSPATSPLLNGKWKFLYASSPSPGLKALRLLLRGSAAAPKSPSGADLVDVADTFLTIGAEQPRAVSEVAVRLFSFEASVKLACKLEAESAVRLVETYDSASTSGSDLPFELPTLPLGASPASFKRSVLISYLDEEMMVVRDAMGRTDVLVRVDAPPAAPPAAEAEDAAPTDLADDVAPSD